MVRKNYSLIINVLIFIASELMGNTPQDLFIKSHSRYPFVKIGQSNIVHISYVNIKSIDNSYGGTLGYYQYNISGHCLGDSIPVLESNKTLVTNSIIANNDNSLIIGFTENHPTVGEGYIYVKKIELGNYQISETITLREDDSYRWIIGNKYLDDSMFCIFWNDNNGGILGQFISNSLNKEGNIFSISDTDHKPISASIDYQLENQLFVATWIDYDSSTCRLYGRIFSRNFSYWSPTLDFNENSFGIDKQVWYSQVLWNMDSSFTIFFCSNDQNLYFQKFNIHGIAVDSMQCINMIDKSCDDFAVARDSLGMMVAVWEDNTTGKILCQRFNADASLLDTVFTVSSGSYRVPTFSLSADFKDGKVAVVWNDSDYNIWLRVFDFEHPIKVEPERSAGLPAKFILASNYPNPFNAATRIRFYLPQSGAVTLRVWDCRGALVKEQQYSLLPAGWQVVGFEADNLPSGIYLYELKFGRERGFGKMVLLR